MTAEIMGYNTATLEEEYATDGSTKRFTGEYAGVGMGWEMVKLGDVCEIIAGQSPESVYYNKSGEGKPFFQGKADFNEDYPSVRYFTTKVTKLAQKNDILLSVRAPVGPTNICNLEACIGRGLASIRVKEKVDYKYVYFHFKAIEKKLSQTGNGSTFSAITTSDVKNIQIPLPPLSTQKQIAEILDKADALRKKDQQLLKHYDQLAQSLFIDLFGDPVKNEKGWEVKKLGEIGKLDRGVSKHRPRNAPELLGGKYPLVQTGDVANSGGNINSYKSTYSEIGLKQSKLWPKGTLCITIAANIAKTGILSFNACFPDSIVGFVPNKLSTNYFIQFLFKFLQKMLEDSAPESAQKNINLDILRNLLVMVPPISIQNQFATQIQNIEQQKEKVKAQLQASEQLFQALLKQAFNGGLN